MIYVSEGHSQRFTRLFNVSENLSSAYIAAIYLLTAYDDIWQSAKSGVNTKKIDFSNMELHGMRPGAYTLYVTAKDLYLDTERLKFCDMFERHIMSETTLTLILNALRIKRTGYNDWLTAEKWEYAQK